MKKKKKLKLVILFFSCIINIVPKMSYAANKNNNDNSWIQDSNLYWYCLDSNGILKTGWIENNGKWYYLDKDGIMKTGWINKNGNWYYLYGNGQMAYNTTIDGYKLDSNGILKK